MDRRRTYTGNTNSEYRGHPHGDPKQSMNTGLRFSSAFAALAIVSLSSCDSPSDADLSRNTPLQFSAIAAGGRHSCALNADGVAFCWGYGFDGQTGLGPSDLRQRPRELFTSQRFSSIKAGNRSTCAIERERAGVYCWGRLGGRAAPTLIEGSEGAATIAMGADHACIRFGDNSVGCFGARDFGQLGPGAPPGPEPVSAVVMVPGLVAAGTLAVGQRHSCAIDQSRSVLCWGMHEGGQLGIGVTTEECPIGPEGELRPCASQPVPVDAGPYTAVAAGLYHTCALRVNGQVECWGDDDSGQLGLETGGTESCDWLIASEFDARPCARRPLALASALTLAQLSAGYFNTCGIQANGQAQCWGTDSFGQTGGLGRPGRPGLVAGDYRWAAITPGQLHACGLTESGAAYCWGDGQYGQLGSSSEFAAQPIPVTGF